MGGRQEHQSKVMNWFRGLLLAYFPFPFLFPFPCCAALSFLFYNYVRRMNKRHLTEFERCEKKSDSSWSLVFLCVYVCACVCTELHISPRDPALSSKSFYATRIGPPEGEWLCVCVCVYGRHYLDVLL